MASSRRRRNDSWEVDTGGRSPRRIAYFFQRGGGDGAIQEACAGLGVEEGVGAGFHEVVGPDDRAVREEGGDRLAGLPPLLMAWAPDVEVDGGEDAAQEDGSRDHGVPEDGESSQERRSARQPARTQGPGAQGGQEHAGGIAYRGLLEPVTMRRTTEQTHERASRDASDRWGVSRRSGGSRRCKRSTMRAIDVGIAARNAAGSNAAVPVRREMDHVNSEKS